jgi:2,4-dienoyl-CoA reductase-like NADH-dependent reductase (Old Yellow Enzyme family)
MLGKSHTEAAMAGQSQPKNTREAFFLRASQEVHARIPELTLILTGGFRSSRSIESAISTGACATVGIGRPAVKYPELPQKIIGYESKYNEQCSFDVEAAPSPGWIATKIRSVGAGAETVSIYFSSPWCL